MQPHQQRVIDEKTALDDKLSKLTLFIGGDIFFSLPNAEQDRLKRQSRVMDEYSGILAERIEVFS